MSKTLGLIHTAFSVVEPTNKIIINMLPEIERINVADDGIIRYIEKLGKITPEISRIVTNYVMILEKEGADCIFVSCSTISPCIDFARPFVSIPVFKIDDPMADEAVNRGARIGVIATVSTTVKPTRDLLMKKAKEKQKEIKVNVDLHEDARKALLKGDLETHDNILINGIKKIVDDVDIIVLAQGSMERLVPKLEIDLSRKVLSCLTSGVEQVKKHFADDR